MTSNYPPGFGSASDLDHVYGPVSDEDLEEDCPECGGEKSLSRSTWHSGGASVSCALCDYSREDEPEWCCDAGPIGHGGRHWKEE